MFFRKHKLLESVIVCQNLRVIFTGGNAGRIWVLNLFSHKVAHKKKLPRHSPINSLQISRCSKWLFTIFNNNCVKVFNLKDPRNPLSFLGQITKSIPIQKITNINPETQCSQDQNNYNIQNRTAQNFGFLSHKLKNKFMNEKKKEKRLKMDPHIVFEFGISNFALDVSHNSETFAMAGIGSTVGVFRFDERREFWNRRRENERIWKAEQKKINRERKLQRQRQRKKKAFN